MAARAAKTSELEGPTGRSWEQWLAFAEKHKLADLPHAEIATRFSRAGVSDWWSQMLTVAYEQHIGRRVPGQAGGTFRTQANRTVAGERPEVLARWVAMFGNAKSFGRVKTAGAATSSVTPKRSYWRLNLSDGAKVQVAFEPRDGGKTMINVTVDKLGSEEAAEQARAVWKDVLARFA